MMIRGGSSFVTRPEGKPPIAAHGGFRRGGTIFRKRPVSSVRLAATASMAALPVNAKMRNAVAAVQARRHLAACCSGLGTGCIS